MGSFMSGIADDNSSGSGSDSDPDFFHLPYSNIEQRYSRIVQHLINSISPSNLAPLRCPSEAGATRLPKVEAPNTKTLNMSEFSLITKQASSVTGLKGDQSRSPVNVADLLRKREHAGFASESFNKSTRNYISNKYLPNEMEVLDSFSGKVFCGSFSKDGKRFITASQDRSIRIFDSTTNSYKFLNCTEARDIGWSVIDVAFSPNSEQFVYSTWSSDLHISSTTERNSHLEPLSLLRSSRRFCVFSVVFSSDGKELLAGANDGCLYIYDLQRRDRTLSISAHEYDVNTVCFADDSSNIIYSGGDDGLIKVWDRRTLEGDPKPVGFLAGHMDGITFIDSKGDGRHLISNSKDQTIKLWDVRVFSGDKGAEQSLNAVHEQTWDYRWQEVPKKLFSLRNKLDGDTSIMTYRGHVVIKTLIRCRFSPAESTGQRYIYTGCGAGRLVIYDALTGKMVQSVQRHNACVRDVHWHPHRNEILSSSWDGTVGKWYHATSNKAEPSVCPRNPRRSRRLALKRTKLESD